jgi:hypothetical protein
MALDPAWLSNDETVAAFFDRLEDSAFPGAVPESFHAFRRQCEAREKAGRKHFGLAYLSRKNLREGAEEEADAVIYRHLHMLQRLRDAGDDEGIALVLEACRHSYEAYRCDREVEARLRGSP